MGEEQKLRTAWAAKLPEYVPRWYNARLGTWHNNQYAELAKVLMRYADLIYMQSDVMEIVEFKVKPSPGAFGQLRLYHSLFTKTVEFKPYWNYPVKLRLVVPFNDVEVRALCESSGVTFEVFDLPP